MHGMQPISKDQDFDQENNEVPPVVNRFCVKECVILMVKIRLTRALYIGTV